MESPQQCNDISAYEHTHTHKTHYICASPSAMLFNKFYSKLVRVFVFYSVFPVKLLLLCSLHRNLYLHGNEFNFVVQLLWYNIISKLKHVGFTQFMQCDNQAKSSLSIHFGNKTKNKRHFQFRFCEICAVRDNNEKQ